MITKEKIDNIASGQAHYGEVSTKEQIETCRELLTSSRPCHLNKEAANALCDLAIAINWTARDTNFRVVRASGTPRLQ